MEYDFVMDGVRRESIPDPYFLIGLINRFCNSFQAAADGLFPELSWKQLFFLNCVALFEEAPAIKDMAELLGCSHQNAKQIVTKLEKLGYAHLEPDKADKRKQRIRLTEKAHVYRREHHDASETAMGALFDGLKDGDLQTTIRVLVLLTERIEIIRTGERT